MSLMEIMILRLKSNCVNVTMLLVECDNECIYFKCWKPHFEFDVGQAIS